MTIGRDVKSGGPGQVPQSKSEGVVPGKRTLVDAAFGGAIGAAEAVKGGADHKTRGAPSPASATGAEHAPTGATVGSPGTARGTPAGGPTIAAAPGPAEAPVADPAATEKHVAAEHAPAAASAGPTAAPVAKQERVVPRIDLGGSASATSLSSSFSLDMTAGTKQQKVAATGAPTVNAAAGSNDCTPGSVSGASVTWNVVAAPATWGVNVTGFTTTGAINVAPWPSKPSDLVTPNTANPIDGGNITDAAGNNNWKFAIKEMEEYNQAGGGRSSHWHAYEASKAHEWAHWNTDWMVTCIGALWPAANTDLDAITIPKASAADAAAAKPLLQAKIDARMATLDAALTAIWVPIPDTPGVAGSTGYIAGQAVLNPLIAAVKAYAAKKGWK